MFIYTFFHIPTGDYELIFIGHRILFNAVKYANSLISFLLLFDGKLWHSKLTFFSFELKIWNSEHPQHPLVPVTGVLWPLTSFLPPALCSGCPSLNCLTRQLMAGERECRLGLPSQERDSCTVSCPSGMPPLLDLGTAYTSSPAQEWVNITSWGGHLTEWTWLVGHWGSQALLSNCRPFIVLYFCF